MRIILLFIDFPDCSMPRASTKTTAKKAKTSSPRKKPKAKSNAGWRRWLWRWFFRLSAIFIVVTAAWVYSLDVQVRQQFTGKKWDLPARVYARPLEIYEGLLLSADDLQQTLEGLGYKPVKRVSAPGQFSRKVFSQKNQQQLFTFYTRGFDFGSQIQASSKFEVVLSGGQVITVNGLSAGEWQLRLEPLEIGSIYPRHGEDRIVVKLGEVPELLAESLMAVEDRYFAHHHGISFRGLARAMLANVQAGAWVQGGSTLTQQLVKNFYLTQERHLWRKVQEAVMAILLEWHYSKADILEAYINEVYLGQSGPRGIHGFGLAAGHYFNQPLKSLEPHQIALLVGLAKGASYYNPWRSPKRALQRRNLVLKIMADNQLITSNQLASYQKKPLSVIRSSQLRLGDYPAFLDLVKRQLLRDYQQEDLQSNGLRIFTTLSPTAQSHTEAAVQNHLKRLQAHKNATKLQAASVITRVGSGEVVALVGDKNPRYKGFNRALDVRRPIGSLVKPFVYLAALKFPKQFTLASIISDEPITVNLENGKQWQPKNFNGESHGDVMLYEALANSYNQSTVAMGMQVGVSQVVMMLKAAGFDGDINALPSLLLGALELSPIEVSHLYHTLAADGVYVPLRSILSVVNADGEQLQRYPLASETRIPASLSYLMHYNLQAVMTEGTGRKAASTLPGLAIAGKTGTSNQQRDSWFAGYSADHLGVVWVGNDDNAKTPYTGSSAALPIWADIFSRLPTQGIVSPQPDTVEYYWIDRPTGLLSNEGCGEVVLLPFIAGSQPVEQVKCSSDEESWWQRLFKR